jgi:hypothetical protein
MQTYRLRGEDVLRFQRLQALLARGSKFLGDLELLAQIGLAQSGLGSRGLLRRPHVPPGLGHLVFLLEHVQPGVYQLIICFSQLEKNKDQTVCMFYTCK